MAGIEPKSWAQRCARLSSALLLAALLVTLTASPARAAVTSFGSPLSTPATLDTAYDLNYAGTNTVENGSGESFHTYHYGADAAIWSTSPAGGGVPVDGQALKVRLEGCAKPASGGPAPLTQIHFQDLSPLPGGGAKVNLSSQPYDIPVCGQGGASGSTVTTYEPVNLCVSRGDYVAFNEEGGYVPRVYQSGVPYEVLGAVQGASFDSFIRGNGTNNGAILSSSDATSMDGFAANQNEELMMQVTLGTGPDARYVCPGGTKDAPPVQVALPPVKLVPQTDGVNHQRIVAVALYCRVNPVCKGVLTLTAPSSQATKTSYGHTSFSVAGKKTSHVNVRVSPQIIKLLRKHRGGVRATLTVTVEGTAVTQMVLLKL
jgi:hypothetical protein